MKNKLYIFFLALFAVSFFSCSDDDKAWDEENNPEREFMTMFRYERNTGITSDPYASQVVNVNDIQLYWYGVNTAAGYRIQVKFQTSSWDRPEQLLLDTIVGPEVLSLKLEDMQYSTNYSFAIQTQSAKGEGYHSKWYGYGDGGHPNDYMNLLTQPRYAVPDVLAVENVTKTSFRIVFDLTFDPKFAEHFEEENGEYVMDEIKVEPSFTNRELPSQVFKLTDADKARGYIDVDGLQENAVYMVNGFNNRIKRYWDRLYNTTMVRMHGDVGEPILIEHFCNPADTFPASQTYNASRIDTILQNYMVDNTLAEGTVFLLEGGKTYYMQNTINMSKGFTLKSNDPEKRAVILLGIGKNADGSPRSCNFSFGRNPQSGEMGGINVQSITFDGINFDSPEAINYGENNNNNGTGNYFINQNSGAMPFSLESFEIRNCDFTNMLRGWIRFQGPNRKIIQKFVMDNVLNYNSGYYDLNGRGYAWVAGDGGNANTNLFNDFSMTNCTFLDSPRHALLSENGNLAWPSGVSWHIRLENNTFVNFSTRTAGRVLFEMRYLPDNSTITCKKNLFVQTKVANDNRTMYLAGIDIRRWNGMSFDFADNYSTNTNLTNGQIFTGNLFSATNYGIGVQGGALNAGGLAELTIKLGATGISPTDLMTAPNALGINGQPNMHEHDVEGLYYKNTAAVKNHEIYKKGIGDPRWRKNVTP